MGDLGAVQVGYGPALGNAIRLGGPGRENRGDMGKRFLVAISACVLGVSVVVPSALAHDCFVAKKPATAGAVVEVNVVTGRRRS